MTGDAGSSHYEVLLDLPFPAAIIQEDGRFLWHNNRWGRLPNKSNGIGKLVSVALHSVRSTPRQNKQYSHLPSDVKALLEGDFEGVFIARLDPREDVGQRYYLSLMDLPREDDAFRHAWETVAEIAGDEQTSSLYYWNIYRGANGRPYYFASDYKTEGGVRVDCSLDDLPAMYDFGNFPVYRAFMEELLLGESSGEKRMTLHIYTPKKKDRYYEIIGQTVHGDERILAKGLAVDVTSKVMARQAQEQSAHLNALRFSMTGVVHEFNNMLTSWQAQMEFLGMALPVDPKHEAHEELERLKSDLERGHKVSHALMQMAALATNPPAQIAPELAHPTSSDLSEKSMVRIIDAMEVLCRDINFEPEMKLGGFEVRSDVDETRLCGALVNLTLNSLRAIHQKKQGPDPLYRGRIRVKFEAHPGRPGDWEDDDADPCKDGCLQITVEDNGIGMTPDVLERCAEPFFTTDRENGHGMGLSQTSALVTEVNGAIKVKSVEGVGTKVMIFLPVT